MSSRKQLLILAALALAAFSQAVAAQTAPHPDPAAAATFTAQSQLVIVPATVTGRDAQHVSGLSVSDFSVRENRKTQKISVFEEIKASAEPLRRTNTPGIYTNSYDRPSPRRLVVIAVDTVNSQFLDQSWGRRQLMNFLDARVNTGALFALVVMNGAGISVVHDATSDPSVLIGALRKVQISPPPAATGKGAKNDPLASVSDANEPDSKTDTEVPLIKQLANGAEEKMSDQLRVNALKVTLESLETIARIYAGVPGRKALVWVTGSFPYNPFDQSEYEHTWKVLNDANFSLYGVDLRGLVNPGAFSADIPRFSDHWVQNQNNWNTNTITTLQLFAAATGGEAFYNTNDIVLSLDRATRDSGSYYLLGYYRSAKDAAPGWRELKVSVRNKGVRVRARSGFFVSQSNGPAPPLDDLQMALTAPLEFTGIPLAFRWTEAPGTTSREGKENTFELAILPASKLLAGPNDNQVDLQFVGIATDADGKLKAQFSQPIESTLSAADIKLIQEKGFIYKGQFRLPPGEYTIRVVVRDNRSGKIGSLIVALRGH